MPGSLTTPGRMGTRAIVLMRVAFHNCNSVSTRNQKSYAAQWLAYALPCRRFACTLAGTCARLGADAVRYSFTVVDSHHLLLAGLTGALQIFPNVPASKFAHPPDRSYRCEYPPQGSRGFYIRAYCALLPPHTPDMLTVRTQAIDGTGTFTLPDFQPCRLLIPCSGDFAPGRGGLRQVLGVSSSPCCRFHPAEMETPRRSDFDAPCCLRP